MLKNSILFVISLLLLIFISEFVLYSLSQKGFLNIDRPLYSQGKIKPRFWADVNPDFGMWHEPFSRFHQKKSCFEVDYRANSDGARDIEREKISTEPRVLVLGDSFVEGFGVSENERFSNLLEQKTKIEHLNFGAAGGFGPTQYYLLYKTLAKNFSHEVLLIGILPFNDFLDDDFEFGKKAYPFRYRPYWVGKNPDYQLIYYQKKYLAAGSPASFFSFLKSYSYLYNAIERATNVLLLRRASPDKKTYAGYYDYTPDQWQRMQYSLQKIKEEAGGRRVVIFSIPSLSDFSRFDEKIGTPFSKEMKVFAHQTGLEYIDLLPEMYAQDPTGEKYFLSCDGHWNSYGHEVVAKILKEKFSFYEHPRHLLFLP